MSAAATTAAPNRPDQTPGQAPDHTPDPAAGTTPPPSRTRRLLGLLHKLVDYGRQLAHTLQQRTTTAAPGAATRPLATLNFGPLNLALILARIVRGLRLAAALEARLVSRPVREAAAPAHVRAPADRPPPMARPAAPRARRAASPLPDVPTAEEIAAALRHRPAGAVIADICRDLGIGPAHPLWREVMLVVTEFGGNFTALVKDLLHRLSARCADPSAGEADAEPASWSQAAAAHGTGPP